ncbi:hypothetical protein EJ06DRAFT_537921 [Trichodelitschia bisporula]|uniref:Metallo-dependent phosphatase n=1 Tax=Trichodelitschia bisporula TaxID=703511 RepID=A0A6G1HWC5_9PEZI|nr:hypothetical protein EJ06DRAFT_537921 [Trichodelitschia bisporula]
MARAPDVILIARHGTRLDLTQPNWHLSSPTPYDPPLTYGGWNQSKALGVRVAKILHARAHAAGRDTQNGSKNNTPDISPLGTPSDNGSIKKETRRKPRRQKVVVHTSPFLRCVQTSVALCAGIAQATQEHRHKERRRSTHVRRRSRDVNIELTDAGAFEDHNEIVKPVLRVDAFLGEWLSPDYFEAITPPPDSALMMAAAKAGLLQHEEIEVFRPSNAGVGYFPGGWSAGGTDKPGGALAQVWPSSHRSNSFSGGSSDTKVVASAFLHTPTGYDAPVPTYAISPADPIPRGYVAHARDACAAVDIHWDSTKLPQNWGDGGTLPEEWSAMHRRFRRGLQGVVGWYSGHRLEFHPDSEDAMTFKEEEQSHNDDDYDLVVVLVTHSAGCNALIGGLTNQPVLLDAGLTSLTMAVRKPNAPESTLPTRPHPDRLLSDSGLAGQYSVPILASTDHLRVTPDAGRLTSLPSTRLVQSIPTYPRLHPEMAPPRPSNSALGSIRRASATPSATPSSASLSRGGSTGGTWSAASASASASAVTSRSSSGLWSRPVVGGGNGGGEKEKEKDTAHVVSVLPDNAVTVHAPDPAPTSPPTVRILHFNDVYHVDASSAEPVGGISRFQAAVNYYRSSAEYASQPDLVTVFSGDAFNPSLESSVTKGAHMVPVLNNIGTDVACVGNHDLDFGVAQFEHLSKQCHFPWLLANVLDPGLGPDVPLGHARKTHLHTTSSGLKIGFIGLAEKEWLETINSLPPDLIFQEPATVAAELVPGLRAEGAEIVVAITHMREPNDWKLAEEVESGLLDLVLGGHDHFYAHKETNGVHVLRSGSDFKQLSYLEGWKSEHGPWAWRISRRDITSSYPQDAAAVELVRQLTNTLHKKLDRPIGYTAQPLDARFTTVRTRESNIGNFVADVMRSYYGGDACLMAAGTIRGDQIYGPGVLKLRDIMNCFPFEDPVVVIRVTGKALHEALENSVALYPALEGRFPQVSNITFSFNPSLARGSRVTHVAVGDAPLDPKREYTLVTRGYMARGKDGYSSLLIRAEGGETEEVVSEENGVLISTLLRQYFLSLKVLGRWRRWGGGLETHWAAVQESLVKGGAGGLVDGTAGARAREGGDAGKGKVGKEIRETELNLSDDDDEAPERAVCSAASGMRELDERERGLARRVVRKWWRVAGLKGEPGVGEGWGEGEFVVNWTKAIAPRVEGRIKLVGKEEKK